MVEPCAVVLHKDHVVVHEVGLLHVGLGGQQRILQGVLLRLHGFHLILQLLGHGQKLAVFLGELIQLALGGGEIVLALVLAALAAGELLLQLLDVLRPGGQELLGVVKLLG